MQELEVDSAGWVKVDRKILRWEWYSDLPVKTLFIHLILSAQYQNGRWMGIEVKRGQLITGRKALASDTGLSEKQVRRALEKLSKSNEIIIETANTHSVITICKYNDYQSKENDEGQQRANGGPTEGQRGATYKKDKKDKKEKKLNPAKPEPELPFRSDAFVFAWGEWEQDRRERGKKITHGAKVRQFKFLKSKTEVEAIEIINHAIQQGWQGLYPINNHRQRKSINPGKIQ